MLPLGFCFEPPDNNYTKKIGQSSDAASYLQYQINCGCILYSPQSLGLFCFVKGREPNQFASGREHLFYLDLIFDSYNRITFAERGVFRLQTAVQSSCCSNCLTRSRTIPQGFNEHQPPAGSVQFQMPPVSTGHFHSNLQLMTPSDTFEWAKKDTDGLSCVLRWLSRQDDGPMPFQTVLKTVLSDTWSRVRFNARRRG